MGLRAVRYWVAALGAAAMVAATAAERLPGLNAQGDRFTVSGLSSGAYMAVQVAVAHSARVAGVGVFAGGPYYCVGINPARIEKPCMEGNPGADGSIRDAERLAGIGLVDSTANLRRLRAWLLAGEVDTKVVPSVVRSSADFFAHYNPSGTQFSVEKGLAHGLPTPATGVACDTSETPFLNRCGVDRVGDMLAALHPGATASGATQGRVLEFRQAEFVPTWRRWWALSSLADQGYAFIPAQCEKGVRCRVHVALHGCKQGATLIQQVFVRDAGYNGWAAAHDTIVLYPQVKPSAPTWMAWWLPFNPNGCWDWWGYTGTDYAVNTGVQIKAIVAMVDRLAQPH
jgi:poly(3-hydroxybutyrate) depolymerase